MKRTLISISVVTSLVLSIPAGAFSEDAAVPATAKATPSGILIKDSSPSQPGWLQVGGQIRGRFEGSSGTSGTSGNYYLSRIRVELAVRPYDG